MAAAAATATTTTEVSAVAAAPAASVLSADEKKQHKRKKYESKVEAGRRKKRLAELEYEYEVTIYHSQKSRWEGNEGKRIPIASSATKFKLFGSIETVTMHKTFGDDKRVVHQLMLISP